MFQFGGLGTLFGGLSPQKTPRRDGTALTSNGISCPLRNKYSSILKKQKKLQYVYRTYV